MSMHYDVLETRDPSEREREILTRLPQQIAHAQASSPYFAEALAKVDARTVNSRAALSRLPVLRKHALIELQKQHKPFGGLTATPLASPDLRFGRIFASPGPIYRSEERRVGKEC